MSIEKEFEKSSGEAHASTGKMISYSIGDIVAYYLLTAYSIYVFYYYEVEVGLAVGLVALAFIIFAVWNMINDPLLGYLTDKPLKWTRRYGMRFPWIMIGMFPTIILYLLIYTVPFDAKTNPWSVFLYMVIITCLFDTFYSLYYTHFYGTYTNQFRTDEERRKASLYDNIIPGLGVFVLGLIPPLLIVYGDRSTYILAVLIIAIIMVVCAIFSIPGVSESDELKEIFIRGYEKAERISFFKTLKTVFKQRNFVIFIASYVIFTTAYTLYLASEIYFMKDVLGLPLYYAVFTGIATYIGFIISIPIWSKVVKKLKNANTYTLSFFIVGLCLLPQLWITTIEEAIIFSFIGGFGFGCFYYVEMMTLADVNDEVATVIGKRQESTLLGISMFFERMSLIFQAIIFALVHILTAYNPDPHAKQTSLAIWGIRIHSALIPSLLCFIGFIILLKWYNLKGERKHAMVTKLKDMGL